MQANASALPSLLQPDNETCPMLSCIGKNNKNNNNI